MQPLESIFSELSRRLPKGFSFESFDVPLYSAISLAYPTASDEDQ